MHHRQGDCIRRKKKPNLLQDIIQASLIKELERRELGTKATRADIIDKLYDRKYITGNKIEVNQLW